MKYKVVEDADVVTYVVVWGTKGLVGPGYDPLPIWQQYAPDVCGEAMRTGHFVPEEAPDLVTAALRDFLD